MIYYLCARCNHITKQKIEMKRHLEKRKKCEIKNNENQLNDNELYLKSLEKYQTLNEKKIIEQNNEEIENELICKKCFKKFSNKGNLNKHMKNICDNISKIENKTMNIQNIGVQNITNKIININLSNIKGFDQEWDVTKIDHKKKGEILLSNSKFTKTLENILKNDINLNVIMNDENDNTGIVYINEKNRYEPMTKKEIIDRSMKKVYDHLKEFYREIINNNTDDLSIISLENELKTFEKKYRDFLKFEDAKNIVNNTFSKLYSEKKEDAENIYYNFVDNKLMIEEY